MPQLLAEVRSMVERRARPIKGTAKYPGWHNIAMNTEWSDETHLFTMGAPLDAPELMPAGGIAACVARNEFGDRWNVPVQILAARD